MKIDELNKLIELMNKNDLQEIEVVEDDRKVRLVKKHDSAARMVPMPMAMPAMPVAAAQAHAPAPAAHSPSGGGIEIKSPMVGTFYRSSNPEAPPYANVGDRISKDSSVCIIEAMKVFNEIKAEMDGVIEAVLVENGQSVEYGQPLFRVKPN
ncbi:MAG: acetyl-CoA carboxylase biotin carboxyl carrier protein [Planctomycetes bacterium]|nr:acetyl-CoA carboxylase biotin carboxyl carrier protein [Planctomycetota bacterium]